MEMKDTKSIFVNLHDILILIIISIIDFRLETNIEWKDYEQFSSDFHVNVSIY